MLRPSPNHGTLRLPNDDDLQFDMFRNLNVLTYDLFSIKIDIFILYSEVTYLHYTLKLHIFLFMWPYG